MKKHLLYAIPIAVVVIAVALTLLLSRGGDILVADTENAYTGIIIYDSESEAAKNAAGELRLMMNSRGLSNIHGTYSADSMSDELEIILGASDREVSRRAAARLDKMIAASPDDLHWCFAYLDGKISIVASSADAYEKALRVFFERYFDGVSLRVPDRLVSADTLTRVEFEGQFLLEEGNSPSPEDIITMAELPNLGEEYDAGQGSSLYVMQDAEIWEYTALRRSIEDAGFVYYTGNVIGDNLYATYITNTQILHTMFIPSSGEIRTAVDRRGEGIDGFALPALRSENIYNSTTDSVMTMVAIENSDWEWPGGLCMIFKLADGRFVIIDAGQNATATRVSSAERIYNTLAKHAGGNEKVEVAAWLITHIHGDHYGGLLDLARGELADRIEIDTLIYNQSADVPGLISDTGCIREIIEGFDIKNVVKAHPGQELFFADLTLTVYGTQDLIIENNPNLDNVNEHSIVTMIDFSGKRILSLADAFPTINKKLAATYKTELKADVLQTAHHGYPDTGAKSVNTYANPDIVLWSNAKKTIEEKKLTALDINKPLASKTWYMLEGGNIDFDSSFTASEPYTP